MITFCYSQTGIALPDYICDEICQNIKDILEQYPDNFDMFSYSTENFFYAIRAWIAEGKIDHSKIQFLYEGTIYSVNKYGVTVPRETFMDHECRWSERILTASFNLQKQEKKNK